MPVGIQHNTVLYITYRMVQCPGDLRSSALDCFGRRRRLDFGRAGHIHHQRTVQPPQLEHMQSLDRHVTLGQMGGRFQIQRVVDGSMGHGRVSLGKARREPYGDLPVVLHIRICLVCAHIQYL